MKTASKNSPFAKILDAWPEARLREVVERAGAGDVRRALGRELLHPEDLAALLSPAAAPFLEDMAQAAHRLTRQHFGRTIGLVRPHLSVQHLPLRLHLLRFRGHTPAARARSAP